MGERIVAPAPLGVGPEKKSFTRGAGEHRSVSWLALEWIVKNARHLLASNFASDAIDARDWMTPDEPPELCARIATVLGARAAAVGAPTLTEALGRDVWIDYVADTGDDDAVSKAVARIVAQAYEVKDAEGRLMIAPRGDLLCFGGDTAYPVATAAEIRARLLTPWNEVLDDRDDGKRRTLLGVPGNHDWDDGLDGFNRLFRRRARVDVSERKTKDAHGVLALHGYEPVQSASYFDVPVAPGLELWGVDRQLRHVDYRQRQFFARSAEQNGARARIVMQADPHRVFGHDNAPGMDVATRLGIDAATDPHLLLSGDIHQYQRWANGPSLHVTAGGGGAALHGASLPRRRTEPFPEVEFPTAEESRPLLRETVARVSTGKAGYVIPVAIFLVAWLVCAVLAWPLDRWGFVAAAGVLFLASVAGARAVFGRDATWPAMLLGAAVAAPPALMAWQYPEVLLFAGDAIPALLSALGSAATGALMSGVSLWLVARSGADDYIAWAAIAHPGFKHFLRLRVHRDGSRVDAWCFGLRDPCADREQVLLVDHFTWPAR